MTYPFSVYKIKCSLNVEINIKFHFIKSWITNTKENCVFRNKDIPLKMRRREAILNCDFILIKTALKVRKLENEQTSKA